LIEPQQLVSNQLPGEPREQLLHEDGAVLPPIGAQVIQTAVAEEIGLTPITPVDDIQMGRVFTVR
jgi:hypothetical protein